MTDEQIKLNAEAYADQFVSRCFCGEWNEVILRFTAGAHSRDEEIDSYRKAIKNMSNVINRLLNPWISVKDHLPEMFVDSKGITHDFSIKVLVTDENNPNYWHVAEYYTDKNEWCCLEHPTYIIDNVTHWMPIPKV